MPPLLRPLAVAVLVLVDVAVGVFVFVFVLVAVPVPAIIINYILRRSYTVNLGLVSMNYIFRERNLIYLHGKDKVRS